jgi:hypothetical protein
MKLPAGKINWVDHVRGSEEYPESISDCCRVHGLSIHSLWLQSLPLLKAGNLETKTGGFKILNLSARLLAQESIFYSPIYINILL